MNNVTDHSQDTSMSSVAENGVMTPAAGNSEGASNHMPEQPDPDNRATTGTTDHSASAVNGTMEELMPGDVIFRRVLPETLPTLHFQTAQGFEESGTKDKCIEDSQGIAGVFYLRIHESWRCVSQPPYLYLETPPSTTQSEANIIFSGCVNTRAIKYGSTAR